MRPHGDLRRAARDAAAVLPPDRPGLTWRDMLASAQAHLGALGRAEQRRFRQTVKNMAHAGELRRVGVMPAPGSRRPLALYAPAQPAQRCLDLDAAMRGWVAAGV